MIEKVFGCAAILLMSLVAQSLAVTSTQHHLFNQHVALKFSLGVVLDSGSGLNSMSLLLTARF